MTSPSPAVPTAPAAGAARTRLVVATAIALGALGGAAAPAVAQPACSAGAVSAADPGCPAGTGPCTITRDLDASGCVLDFGARPVTVAGGTVVRVGSTVVLRAGSVRFAPGSFVDGRADAPNGRGALVVVQATGAVEVQRAGTTNARIDVSAAHAAGAIVIGAGGPVTVAGRLLADRTAILADGGVIAVTSGADVGVAPGAEVSATGGRDGFGGTILLSARGRMDVLDGLDASGGDGGTVRIDAGGPVALARVLADANGDTGTGGTVTVRSGGGITTNDVVRANGSTSIDGTSGGDGGTIDLQALGGDVAAAAIAAEGASPDGGGGSASLTAAGSVRVAATGLVSVRGNGGAGGWGELLVDAGFDALLGANVDVSGGASGGIVEVTARRHVTARRLDASAREAGGFGGFVTVTAGAEGAGDATLTHVVDASGGGCSAADGCGSAGNVEVTGCNVTVAATGQVLARADWAGFVTLVARELLTVLGAVDASRTTAAGVDGVVDVAHPDRRAPLIAPGTLRPPAAPLALATCTAAGQASCLDPCPACGNGVVEHPETCDTPGPPVGCDGCSPFCRVEACGGASGCLLGACTPSLGCVQAPAPDGTPCGDGLVCNGDEACRGGACVGGSPPACADADPCTADACTEPAGCTHTPAPDGTPCDDGRFCTLNDACAAGACTAATARSCADPDVCTEDVCDEAADACVHSPSGACCGNGTPDAGEECDDGNATGGDGCSAACTRETSPAALVPGGGLAGTDCALEWALAEPVRNARGVAPTRQPCRDGDPRCDVEPAPGACVVRVALCANNADPALPLCTPASPTLGTPAVVEVVRPNVRDAGLRPEDAANRSALLAAAAAAAAPALGACTPPVDVRVPRPSPTRRGTKSLKLRARTTRNVVDTDVLKLVCLP